VTSSAVIPRVTEHPQPQEKPFYGFKVYTTPLKLNLMTIKDYTPTVYFGLTVPLSLPQKLSFVLQSAWNKDPALWRCGRCR
jgi:hypothetical protein